MTQQGQQGTLEKFKDMPMDIIAETLQYVWPIDLYNLVMTSKEFHEFLTQPRSTFIWKLSRYNSGILMKRPPRALSELQFAKLLFDEHCQRCKKPGVREVNWDHFTRICEKCSQSLYKCCSTGERIGVPPSLKKVIRKIFPVENNVEGRDPRQTVHDPRQEVHRPRRVVHTPDVMLLKKAWKNRGNTSTADFIKRYKTVFQKRKDDAVACRRMQSKLRELMFEQLYARRTAIKAKLTALGWGEELAIHPLEALLWKDPRVDRPSLLTEQEWKTLGPELNDLMAKIWTSHLVKQRWNLRALRPRFEILASVVSAWRRQESFELPFARARDMASFPEVKDIIGSPPEVKVSVESFEKLRSHLPTMLSDWAIKVEGFLQDRIVDIMATAGMPIPIGLAPLSLAIAFMFICKDCKTGRQFPEMISHACSLQRLHNCADVILEDDPSAGYEWCASEALGEGGALQNRVDLAVEAATSVIKMYGYNPGDATAEKMDQSDIRLICQGKCRRWIFNDRNLEAMHWRRAISHAVFEHEGEYSSKVNGPPIWEVASEEKAAAARELENVVQAGWEPLPSHNVWVCNHCNNPDLCIEEDLKSHMRIGHSITEPTNSDIRCDLHCGVMYADHTEKLRNRRLLERMNYRSLSKVPRSPYLQATSLRETGESWV